MLTIYHSFYNRFQFYISLFTVPHYDLQISGNKRDHSLSFCVILGSDWQAIELCDVLTVLFVPAVCTYHLICIVLF